MNSPNGAKRVYGSTWNKAASIGFEPAATSMEGVAREARHILNRGRAMARSAAVTQQEAYE